MAENCGKEALVCKYNQTGYCKFGFKCLKTHNNTLCKDRVCRNRECSNRHPKTCRDFAQNKFCSRQDYCAYAHHKSNEDSKIRYLEREIKLLQEENLKYIEIINVKLSTIETNESEITELKLEVMNQRKQISDLIVKVKDLELGRNITKTKEQENSYQCDKCEYNATTEMMLRKHSNTKHNDTERLECTLCEENFTVYEEYTNHRMNHLTEIETVDIEFLKNGHEIFECSICKFQSNDTDVVKNHLAEHALKKTKSSQNKSNSEEAKVKAKSKAESKAKAKAEILKTGDWRDLYDSVGNPLFETSDESSDEE